MRLAAKVDAIKDTLENDEQKVRMKSVMNSFISNKSPIAAPLGNPK